MVDEDRNALTCGQWSLLAITKDPNRRMEIEKKNRRKEGKKRKGKTKKKKLKIFKNAPR